MGSRCNRVGGNKIGRPTAIKKSPNVPLKFRILKHAGNPSCLCPPLPARKSTFNLPPNLSSTLNVWRIKTHIRTTLCLAGSSLASIA